MSYILKIRVACWKGRLRRAAVKRREILNESGCGVYLLRHLSPEFRRWDDKYNEAMDWLRENDPEFPKEYKVGA